MNISLFLQPSLSSIALISVLTHASAAVDTSERESYDLSGVEEIIVTNTRSGGILNVAIDGGALGQKSILDTPFSMTVVDSEDIAKRQATTVAQIFMNDPSVFSFATAGTTNWWGTQIRGLGVRNYYVDGVPIQLNWGGRLSS